jgi:hypothetical protein
MTGTKDIGMDVHKESISIAVSVDPLKPHGLPAKCF